MAIIYIYLEEGFFKEFVEIYVDNKKYYENNDVTTKAVLGLADTTRIEIKDGSANLQIILKNKKISKTIPLNISNSIYISVSIYNESISHRISNEQFDYE